MMKLPTAIQDSSFLSNIQTQSLIFHGIRDNYSKNKIRLENHFFTKLENADLATSEIRRHDENNLSHNDSVFPSRTVVVWWRRFTRLISSFKRKEANESIDDN